MAPRQTGTVAKWLNHKGIGFITPDGETAGENDILVHFMQIKQGDPDEQALRSLEQDSKVEYELQEDPKNPDKFVAISVTGPGGADCEVKTRRAPKGGKAGGRARRRNADDGEETERKPKVKREEADHSHFTDTDKMKKGKVATWINFRGIGFITMEGEVEGKSDILVHFEEIKQGSGDDFKSLKEKSEVEFMLKKDPKCAEGKSIKYVAYNVTGPNGADCEARPRRARRSDDDEE